VKILVNLPDAEVRSLLEYVDTVIDDYAEWLSEFRAKDDPHPEVREGMKRQLRLLRKLRRQMIKQIGEADDG